MSKVRSLVTQIPFDAWAGSWERLFEIVGAGLKGGSVDLFEKGHEDPMWGFDFIGAQGVAGQVATCVGGLDGGKTIESIQVRMDLDSSAASQVLEHLLTDPDLESLDFQYKQTS